MITMITSACICNISQMFSGEHVQCLSLLSSEWHDVKHTKIGRQHKISWPMIFLPLALFPCHCPTIHLASLWPQELNTVLSLTRSPSLFCLLFFFLIEARIAADLHLCAHQICTWAVLCLSAAPCRLTLFTFFIPLYLHRVTWFRAWIKANCLWRHSAKVAAEKSGSLYTMRVKAHMPHSAHVYGHVWKPCVRMNASL